MRAPIKGKRFVRQIPCATVEKCVRWIRDYKAAALAIVCIMIFQLRQQCRVWVCACGQFYLWAGDIWSAHNSQHLFDPYSFTHVLHGILFCAGWTWLFPRIPWAWRMVMTVGMEALWEVLENSEFIIQRYREATIGLGYEGDSVVNSLTDVLCCVIGFLLARHLGWRRSLVLFVALELALLFWIRDNLTLNILMLTFPVESIKAWQMLH